MELTLHVAARTQLPIRPSKDVKTLFKFCLKKHEQIDSWKLAAEAFNEGLSVFQLRFA
jgi:hypothetical protein